MYNLDLKTTASSLSRPLFILGLGFLLGAVFFVPKDVKADWAVASQIISSTTQVATSSPHFVKETLGTGLTGNVTTAVIAGDAGSVLSSFSVELDCYTSTTYLTPCGLHPTETADASIFISPLGHKQFMNFSFAGTNYALQPTMYYILFISAQHTNDIYYGTNTESDFGGGTKRKANTEQKALATALELAQDTVELPDPVELVILGTGKSVIVPVVIFRFIIGVLFRTTLVSASYK